MGLIKTAAKAAVFSSVHGRVQRRQQARWAQEDQALLPAPHPGVGVAAANSPSRLEQLALAAQLRDSGVLSPEEFLSEKSRILNS